MRVLVLGATFRVGTAEFNFLKALRRLELKLRGWGMLKSWG